MQVVSIVIFIFLFVRFRTVEFKTPPPTHHDTTTTHAPTHARPGLPVNQNPNQTSLDQGGTVIHYTAAIFWRVVLKMCTSIKTRLTSILIQWRLLCTSFNWTFQFCRRLQCNVWQETRWSSGQCQTADGLSADKSFANSSRSHQESAKWQRSHKAKRKLIIKRSVSIKL